jgi:hypothetical protein
MVMSGMTLRAREIAVKRIHGTLSGQLRSADQEGSYRVDVRLHDAVFVAPALFVKARLDQAQHRISREIIDFGENGHRQRQPDDFVHKGASRLAPTIFRNQPFGRWTPKTPLFLAPQKSQKSPIRTGEGGRRQDAGGPKSSTRARAKKADVAPVSIRDWGGFSSAASRLGPIRWFHAPIDFPTRSSSVRR